MFYDAVNDCLAALRFFMDWFITSKMIKNLYTALHADDGWLFFDKDLGDGTFRCDEMGILSVNVDLVNNFDEHDHDTIILIKLLLDIENFKKVRPWKKRYVKTNINSVAF